MKSKARVRRPAENGRGDVYTTHRGVEVKIIGLSPLLPDQIEAGMTTVPDRTGRVWGPRPTEPTYEIKTVAGSVEVHKHDLTTLEVKDDPEQTLRNHAAWEAWERACESWDREVKTRLLRVVFTDGIVVPEPADWDEWAQRRSLRGLPAGENEFERLLMYVETDVIGHVNDINEISELVFKASGINISEETAEAAEAAFPDQVAEAADAWSAAAAGG